MSFLDTLRLLKDARAWRPESLTLLCAGVLHRRRNALLGVTDREHLVAAAEWLARAQDAGGDGGVPGRYRLRGGWTSSYPETTGYIVPTLLALESEAGLSGYRERARRCIQFLLGVQLDSGAFPGMEIAENRETPSIFNSAQILHGLTAWHRATGDEKTLVAARRAADWLVSMQDPDGAWRRHLYGSGRTYTYMAHAGCWIAEFGAHVGEERYLDAARRHLEWVLEHVDQSTGWILDCGFDGRDDGREAVLHTIAYTIWGVLLMSHLLRHERGLAVARRAARAVARRLDLSKGLPARLDSSWKPTDPTTCLTGCAQMALIWLELHRIEPDPTWVDAACKAIDLVKRAQFVGRGGPGASGGVAGSDPIWGAYIKLAVPNWAAKFFIDALLAKERALRGLSPLPVRARCVPDSFPDGVPSTLPAGDSTTPGATRPRVVLVSDERSPKVEQFHLAWNSWGFRPDAVVVRRRPAPTRAEALRDYLRDYGVMNLARRFLGRRATGVEPAPRQGTVPSSGVPVLDYCAAHQIPAVAVSSLTDPASLARVRELRPDLLVYAGCGIVRAELLATAPLGMVNAHMGLLPPMRGMNVAEWSAFLGAPTGCTVHLIDPGIDTGDILLFQPVDVAGSPSIDAMRQRVDAAQIRSLGRVVEWVLQHGKLPPRRAQTAEEGRQYFAMHADLRAILEATLRGGASAAGTVGAGGAGG